MQPVVLLPDTVNSNWQLSVDRQLANFIDRCDHRFRLSTGIFYGRRHQLAEGESVWVLPCVLTLAKGVMASHASPILLQDYAKGLKTEERARCDQDSGSPHVEAETGDRFPPPKSWVTALLDGSDDSW